MRSEPAKQDQATASSRAGHLVRGALDRPGRWAPWAAAVALFVLALQTAPEVLDVAAVEGGLLPFVAAAAALPFGLILTRPAVGWLISAASAVVVSLSFPVIDGDPWPWPIVHGLVLLALLFAMVMRPSPRLPRRDQTITVVAGWIATAVLFGLSSAPQIRIGWVVGVTAVVVAGVVVRRLGLSPRPDPSDAERPPDDWSAELIRGFREAFVDWVRSPPVLRPHEAGRGRWSWLRWLPGLPWVLAVGVFWIGLASIRETLDVHDLVLPILAALIALPVGLIGSRVLIGWRIITVTAALIALAGTPSDDGLDPGTWPVLLQLVWLGVTFLVAVRHDRWTTVWVWVATMLVISAGVRDNSGTSVTMMVSATALVFVGDLVRSRRTTARDLARQTELSELEKARRTVLEEKARIARELHDVVAHHMSMVVVQAESAPYRLPSLPEDARAEFASISASARQALTEIRGLLGVLRSDDQDLSRAPQPDLDQLGDLVDSAARSGVPVTMEVSGTPRPVGATLGLSAYRIVQESLANAARHAPGAGVAVRLQYGDQALTVGVVNDASTHAATSGTPGTPGHGIIGMRERAVVVGGTLAAGPRAGGGFEVTATLPFDQEETE